MLREKRLKRPPRGRGELSILSQLLRNLARYEGAHFAELTFNSFPVASGQSRKGVPEGASAELSILSQLLRDRCKQEGSRAASSAFNSFPVASGALARDFPSDLVFPFNSFPVASRSSSSADGPAAGPRPAAAFNSFPVASISFDALLAHAKLLSILSQLLPPPASMRACAAPQACPPFNSFPVASGTTR